MSCLNFDRSRGVQPILHSTTTTCSVVVAGAVAVDIYGDPTRDAKELKSRESNIGYIRHSIGGVGKNIAESLCKLGTRTVFFTAVGKDLAGQQALNHLRSLGLPQEAILQVSKGRTASVCAIHDTDGDLKVAIADMSIFEQNSLTKNSKIVHLLDRALENAQMLAIDANLDPQDIKLLLRAAKSHGVTIWFEPTSPTKSQRIVEAGVLHLVDWLSPNVAELQAIATRLRKGNRTIDNSTPGVESDADVILRFGKAKRVLVTRGSSGASLYRLDPTTNNLRSHHFAASKVQPVNTSGAGDALVGATIWYLVRRGQENYVEAIRTGMQAASRAVMCEQAIPHSFGFMPRSKL